MSKERILFLLGIWVAILPFLGFPNNWRKVFFVISGLGLVALSYAFRKKNAESMLSQISHSIGTFTESAEAFPKVVKKRVMRKPKQEKVLDVIPSLSDENDSNTFTI